MPDRERRITRHFRCPRGHEFILEVDIDQLRVLCLVPDPRKPCSRIAQFVVPRPHRRIFFDDLPPWRERDADAHIDTVVVPRPCRRIFFDDLPPWREMDADANNDIVAPVTEAPATSPPATEIPSDAPAQFLLRARRTIVLE